jgi:hypothetical protein
MGSRKLAARYPDELAGVVLPGWFKIVAWLLLASGICISPFRVRSLWHSEAKESELLRRGRRRSLSVAVFHARKIWRSHAEDSADAGTDLAGACWPQAPGCPRLASAPIGASTGRPPSPRS